MAAAPPGQIAAHDAGETIAEVWITPHDALARHRAGEIEIIFPTIRNLQAIGRFATSAELLDGGRAGLERGPGHRAAGRARRQRHAHRAARRPRLRARRRCPTPATAARCGDFNEAVRAVSMQANEEGPDAAPGPRPAGATRRP